MKDIGCGKSHEVWFQPMNSRLDVAKPRDQLTCDLSAIAEGLHELAKGGRGVPPAGIIKVIALKMRVPLGQHLDEATGIDVRSGQFFGHMPQTLAIERRIQNRDDAVECQLTADPGIQLAIAFLELPGIDATTRRQT